MQRKMQRPNKRALGEYKNIALLFMMSVCLGGCFKSKVAVAPIPRTLPYKVEVASDRTVIYMQKKIEKQGAQVITLGQDYLVSLPAQLLFPDQSPQLTWGSYQLLNDVACYLQQFRMIAVNVTAYSSQYMSEKREKALTLARAKAVASYLWSQGVDSRFIFTEGLGSDKPIIGMAKQLDSSPNSRIEITFRHVVA